MPIPTERPSSAAAARTCEPGRQAAGPRYGGAV